MRTSLALAALAFATTSAAGPTPPMEPDIPASWTPPSATKNFERREVMIPMRDGVKLKTYIVVPKGAKRLPMVMTRTPYNAGKRSERAQSSLMEATVSTGADVLADGSYILVYQDVRGKYGSEGDYVMTRPLRGPLNDTKVDHSTDAYDTIDWLVKNVKESNGKVGMLGSSYEGFTVLMALVKPHPALRAAVPMCPMVDGWRGDDWFHNGAFRLINMEFFTGQTVARAEGKEITTGHYDDYEAFRRAGSAHDFAKRHNIDVLPYWKKLTEHPAYDAYWQHQAVDRLLAKEPLTVPTMMTAAIWDQEDIYGAHAVYAVMEAKDKANDKNFLVLGPWRHSGINYEGRVLGPLDFGVDTAMQFRRDMMKPFLDARLKDNAPAYAPPAVQAFETGTNVWRKLPSWPAATMKKFYFGGGFDVPKGDEYEEFVSDPAKPVPYVPRPVRFDDRTSWTTWLLGDQRFIADRPDVLVYQSEPLTAPLKLTGAPIANLFASTSGTDADWVVKVIDVYPDEVANAPHLGGYQLPIAMDIFRGRYRTSFEKPSAIPANTTQHYKFALPTVNHVFKPGHRIMIQIQSSWFPLYDRNPQTFVPNIFFAQPNDYKKATHRIYKRGANASFVELPIAR
jgi:putative CocE/NonD family hydrolase